MKRPTLLYSVIGFVVVAVIGFGFYWSSTASVIFLIHTDVSSAVLFSQDDTGTLTKVSDIKDGVSQRLGKGTYAVVPDGDHIDPNPIPVTVEGDTTVVINPDYSTTFLASLLGAEAEAITTAVSQQYPAVMQGYSIKTLQLFKKGEWAGGILAPNEFDEQNPVNIHHIVLKKESGKWTVAGTPQLILTTSNTPGIPREILQATNQLSL